MQDSAPRIVLVVEDEILVRMDLAQCLQQAGYQTYEAGNAADAIAILEMHPEIRVVFTDIQMPGDMDGLQLSHYVRERWPPTILIVCSANELPSPDVMPTGAWFMGKPYNASAMGKILGTINEQLAE